MVQKKLVKSDISKETKGKKNNNKNVWLSGRLHIEGRLNERSQYCTLILITNSGHQNKDKERNQTRYYTIFLDYKSSVLRLLHIVTTEIRFFALKRKKEQVLDRGQNGFIMWRQ